MYWEGMREYPYVETRKAECLFGDEELEVLG